MSERRANGPADGGDRKVESLDPAREDKASGFLTTEQGVRVSSTDDSLKVGPRGPTLLEDFHLREKITRFDHERIPERVVHARGSAAHGYFQVYESMAEYTRAKFLQDPSVKTPVFVRFSTVVGSKGSADTVRDVRGFATKFYTEEGNFDLVGNNIPVFFIQDGIKFPDLIHAVKPEHDREMPQAASAHDTFWDFASLVPETTHMLMWVLSDRAIPRSYRMMEGFGVHTFRFVNAAGKSRFVKFHWKPLLGVHSLVWDEAQKLAGKDPDFHRRDLWDAINVGDYPEYELGVQIVEEGDEQAFDFDLLDASKLIPEELVPVRRIGKLTLTRNTDDFFAETEQVAFHTANVVPGIDFTDDPLLQVRNFSYLDTQLLRLGGPNFAEIPINRPLAKVTTLHQDGHMQQRIKVGRASYVPNSLGGGCPALASMAQGAYAHYPEQVDGARVRARSESFKDHYSQATLFWNSQSKVEREHIVRAGRFELGKVESVEVRERMIDGFNRVDHELARRIAEGVGVATPARLGTVLRAPAPVATAAPAPGAPKAKISSRRLINRSEALSMANTVKSTIKSRRVAVLAAAGVAGGELRIVRAALVSSGAHVEVIAPTLGEIRTAEGDTVTVDRSVLTTASVMYDAVFVPGGRESVESMEADGTFIHFLNEAFKHYKPIGASGEGVDLLLASDIQGIDLADPQSAPPLLCDQGVVTTRDVSDLDPFAQALIAAIMEHRHWDRPDAEAVPA
jgi:catalase